MTDFAKRRCTPCEGGVKPLSPQEAERLLSEVPFWTLDGEAAALSRTFVFRDFHETMAFVNAVAWIAHQEGHHPDLTVGYDRCTVRYATHAIGGLSENDFVCAAKVNALLAYA
ncbi:MAG: 4a-hydroxytetrahydrobiopterin dehydratase [Acidobacteriota bacterium]